MILRFCPIRQWSLLVVFILGMLYLVLPLPAHGQTDGGKVYQTHCVRCHGEDGKGQAARAIEPDIPDFTDSAWQKKRSDSKLLESILDGKGSTMPAFRDKKMSEDQARTLVAYIRKFAPKKTEKPEQKEPALDDFDERFNQLRKEMHELQEEYRRITDEASDEKHASPTNRAM
ncbi:MAG TPA: cytochrome c [Gemmataceae bacterium]|nr:cytochrome c [Gemmataceae bacterium]